MSWKNANCYNLSGLGFEEQYNEQCADIQQNEIVDDQSQFFQHGQNEPSPQQSNTHPLPSIESLGISPFAYSQNLSSPQDDNYFLNPYNEETPRPPLPHTIYQPPQKAFKYAPNIHAPQETQKYSQELSPLDQSIMQHQNFSSLFPSSEMQPQFAPQDSLQQPFISHMADEMVNQELSSESWPSSPYPVQTTQQPLPQMHQNRCDSPPYKQAQPPNNILSSLDSKETCISIAMDFRKNYTRFQRHELEKGFQLNYYPTTSRFTDIAQAQNLRERQIEIRLDRLGKLRNGKNKHVTYRQMIELEKEFLVHQYPSKKRQIEIAQTLDLTHKRTKGWFQDRRCKWRRENKVKLKPDISMQPTQTATNLNSRIVPSEATLQQPPLHVPQNSEDSSSNQLDESFQNSPNLLFFTYQRTEF